MSNPTTFFSVFPFFSRAPGSYNEFRFSVFFLCCSLLTSSFVAIRLFLTLSRILGDRVVPPLSESLCAPFLPSLLGLAIFFGPQLSPTRDPPYFLRSILKLFSKISVYPSPFPLPRMKMASSAKITFFDPRHFLLFGPADFPPFGKSIPSLHLFLPFSIFTCLFEIEFCSTKRFLSPSSGPFFPPFEETFCLFISAMHRSFFHRHAVFTGRRLGIFPSKKLQTIFPPFDHSLHRSQPGHPAIISKEVPLPPFHPFQIC